MKKFTQYLKEAPDDDTVADTRKAVLAMITSNLYRFINSKDDKDNKAMLMLVAALGVLSNASEDNMLAISTAKRLAQTALARAGRAAKSEKVQTK